MYATIDPAIFEPVEDNQKHVGELLDRWNRGDREALTDLLPLVEDELRRLARHYLRNERPGHTLQTTALMNEAYVRLLGAASRDWKSRAHFVGMMARIMRHILIDHARRLAAEKRGGAIPLLALQEARDAPEAPPSVDLLAVHHALERLETLDERQARIVELRVFGGLTHAEIGEAIGISVATVKREWNGAKAWLYGELRS